MNDHDTDDNDHTDGIPHVAANAPVDPAMVEALAEIAVRQGLAEIEVRQNKLRIRITRQHPQPVAAQVAPMAASTALPAAAPTPAIAAPASAAAPAAEHPGTIRSPMVGTVYLRPEPNAEKFVEIGGVVKQGDRIMLIEAMKTFNDITAPRAGTLTAVLVNEGEPVEFGEPLLILE